ncbi:30S ribosomal protein S16 [Candidatus Shapirobacteria bacterium]|nr:30S ribosomal protein S16 [Candidatus Shapirobacteria bacterium]
MVKIRLSRIGAKKKASYRIVVTDERCKRNGKTLAILGSYDPKNKPATVKIDSKLLEEWLKKGAQLTPAVKKII